MIGSDVAAAAGAVALLWLVGGVRGWKGEALREITKKNRMLMKISCIFPPLFSSSLAILSIPRFENRDK